MPSKKKQVKPVRKQSVYASPRDVIVYCVALIGAALVVLWLVLEQMMPSAVSTSIFCLGLLFVALAIFLSLLFKRLKAKAVLG
jgi:hypothetical protein